MANADCESTFPRVQAAIMHSHPASRCKSETMCFSRPAMSIAPCSNLCQTHIFYTVSKVHHLGLPFALGGDFASLRHAPSMSCPFLCIALCLSRARTISRLRSTVLPPFFLETPLQQLINNPFTDHKSLLPHRACEPRETVKFQGEVWTCSLIL